MFPVVDKLSVDFVKNAKRRFLHVGSRRRIEYSTEFIVENKKGVRRNRFRFVAERPFQDIFSLPESAFCGDAFDLSLLRFGAGKEYPGR